MISSAFVAARGQQAVSLLLTALPLAERMLLYHMAMTACIMFPERGLLKRRCLSVADGAN